MMKIHTVVFRPWHMPYAWFGRDSGLVSEGLRAIGVESRLVILDTPGMPDDPRFLPARREQFLDPAFWKGLSLDAAVLQGGDAAVEPVAAAIRASGTRLFLRLDSDGVIDPGVDLYLALYNRWWWLAYHHRAFPLLRAVGTMALKLIFPGKYGSGRIARRFEVADGLFIESGVGAARLQRLFREAGRADLAPRVHHLPIPISDDRAYPDGTLKEKRIASVARWYDAQKDAPKLIRVLARVLRAHPGYTATVVGDGDDVVRRLVARHGSDVADRIEVTGRKSHEEIAHYELGARIFICSSRAESMNISSAEALCCGCSVVGPAEIASMHEYVRVRSGTLAWTRRDADFVDAVTAEINAWEAGLRDPRAISDHFRHLLAKETVAAGIVEKVGRSRK